MVDHEPLIRDFLEWLTHGPRSYAETIEAWRTSCPRLTVWEDAMDAGLITRQVAIGLPAAVVVTPAGERLLAEKRSRVSAPALDAMPSPRPRLS